VNIRRIRTLVGAGISIAICLTGLNAPANADIDDLTVDTGCSVTASYTAKLALKPGVYNVYARLGRQGETTVASVFSQGPKQSYGSCDKLGGARVEGTRWQKFKQLHISTEGTYTLQFAASAMAGVPNANRPSIMLVPHVTPPFCHMKDECYVNLYGQKAYLRPLGALLNKNSLRALVVNNPAKDIVKEVRYYADRTLAYTKPTFKAFDTRYIEYGGQRLTRVITYESGQQAVVETIAATTHQDTFYNFLFRLTQRYPDTLRAIGWLMIGLITFVVSFILLRANRRSQAVRAHHGFRSALKPTAWQQLRVINRKLPGAIQFIAAGLAIVMALGIVIVLVNSYSLQIVTVDGRSMEKSYVTGDQVLVNKLPKTIAALNNREYLPSRGDVVIVRAAFGNIMFTENTTRDLTLIKRVIGLPNERVVVKNGKLLIYNQLHPEGFQPDRNSSWESQMTKDLETENIDIELGPSEIFVSGDNRPESIDSRFNGPLATSEIIGVVIAKW